MLEHDETYASDFTRHYGEMLISKSKEAAAIWSRNETFDGEWCVKGLIENVANFIFVLVTMGAALEYIIRRRDAVRQRETL